MSETNTQLLPKKVMVTLDALLDIRFARVNREDPDVALQVSSCQAYFQRTSESFPLSKTKTIGLNPSDSNPDNEDLLPYSIRTTLWSFIAERMVLLLNENTEMMRYSEINLEINTWPFQLTKDEMEMMREVFMSITKNLFDVVVVYMPIESLTPAYVGKNYAALFFYDPSAWINRHQEEMMKGSLVDVELYTPSHFKLRELTEEEKVQFRSFGMSIHDATTMLFSPILKWVFLPVKLYCLECPQNPA